MSVPVNHHWMRFAVYDEATISSLPSPSRSAVATSSNITFEGKFLRVQVVGELLLPESSATSTPNVAMSRSFRPSAFISADPTSNTGGGLGAGCACAREQAPEPTKTRNGTAITLARR